MTICKDTPIVKGCKVEDPNQSPPVLRTNFVPDVNGVTHHDPLACKQVTITTTPPPIEYPIISNKTKLIVDHQLHKDGQPADIDIAGTKYPGSFLKASAFMWTTKDPYAAIWRERIIGGKQEELDYLQGAGRTVNVTFGEDLDDSRAAGIPGARKTSIQVDGGTLFANDADATTIFSKWFDNTRTHYNHAFEMDAPFDQDDEAQFTVFDKNKWRTNFNFEYNYYNEEYEKTLSTFPDSDLTLLPNLYVFETEKHNRRNEQTAEDPLKRKIGPKSVKYLSDHLSLAEFLGENVGSAKVPKWQRYDVKASEHFKYLEDWSKTYRFRVSKETNHAGLTALKKKFKNTVISVNDMELVDKPSGFNAREEMFPMFVNMKFPSDEATISAREAKAQVKTGLPLADATAVSNLSVPLMGFVADQLEGYSIFPFYSHGHVPWNTLTDAQKMGILVGSGFAGDLTVAATFLTNTAIMAAAKLQYDARNVTRLGLATSVPFHKMERVYGQVGTAGVSRAAGYTSAPSAEVVHEYYSTFNIVDWLEQYNKLEIGYSASREVLGKTAAQYGIDWDNLSMVEKVNFVIAQGHATDPAGVLAYAGSPANQSAHGLWPSIKYEYVTGQLAAAAKQAVAIFNGADSASLAILGRYAYDIKAFTAGEFRFFKSLMVLMFSGRLKKQLKLRSEGGNLRPFKRMLLNGKTNTCFNEGLFYRIEKLDKDDNVLQSFYVPNVHTKNILEWVDTQVKYGEIYKYQIYAYHAVLGTEWKYASLYTRGKRARVGIEYKPSYVLVEVPYAFKQGKILDSPPVPPDVDIFSYIDISDRIAIRLSPNVGDRWLSPIIIDPEEQDYIDNLPDTLKKTEITWDKETQKVVRTLKVRYKSDDPNKKYMAYRIDKRPTSYADFAGSGIVVEPKGKGTSASMVDKIRPNHKYYYVFRTIDTHNHMSYPSAAYEVEMVDDHGSIYLVLNVIDFKVDPAMTYSKPLKKYIHISATDTQSMMDLENTQGYKDANENIEEDAKKITLPKLGIEEKSVWNKKFKLRLTSKKTGRKIDVNFRFKQEHNKNEKA